MDEIKSQNNIQDSLKEKILRKIKSGEVSRKSKAYFMLRVCLLIVIVFLIFVASVLLISYTLFSLRVGGHLFLLGFGARGLYEFILYFPWLILVASALLLIILDSLIKRFRFGYHSPIIYLFLGTIAIIAFVGSIVNFTPFHDSLMHKAEGKNLPMLGGFYSGLRKSHKEIGIYRGIVVSVNGNSFDINHEDYDDSIDVPITVYVPDNFIISSFIQVGDDVFVAGDLVNGAIHAYGIKKLSQVPNQ